jgi:hypothetical protein
VSRPPRHSRSRARAGFGFVVLLFASAVVAPAFAETTTTAPSTSTTPTSTTTSTTTTTRPATTTLPATTAPPQTTAPPETTAAPETTLGAAAAPRTTARTTTTRLTTTSVTTTVNAQLVAASNTTVVRAGNAIVSTPTTSIDKVINSSAGSKVRSAVRALEIIAGATALLTLLYWWHTRPRRRVQAIARKAEPQSELTPDESREVYAGAVAGSSVFADDDPTGELVPANAGIGDAAGAAAGGGLASDNLPLAARLPRAMTATPDQPATELTPTEAPPARPRRGHGAKARPNPRPRPRRTASPARPPDTTAGDPIADIDD